MPVVQEDVSSLLFRLLHCSLLCDHWLFKVVKTNVYNVFPVRFSLLADILYDSWSPAMTVSSICISILSMLSSSTSKVCKIRFLLSLLPVAPFLAVGHDGYRWSWNHMASVFERMWLLLQQRPADNDRYVKNCKNGRSPKETRWWFHDDKVWI